MSSTSSALDSLTPAPDGWSWAVLHARPRCEKKLEALAPQKQAVFYLPCTRRAHQYGNRKRIYEVPLFTGYVFGKMPDEHLSWYRSNRYVANIIPVVDEEKLLTPLRAIATALSSGLDLEVHSDIRPGTRIRITAGPLKGLETEVQQIAGEDKVILHLEMIQKTVAVEIPLSDVKPIP